MERWEKRVDNHWREQKKRADTSYRGQVPLSGTGTVRSYEKRDAWKNGGLKSAFTVEEDGYTEQEKCAIIREGRRACNFDTNRELICAGLPLSVDSVVILLYYQKVPKD